MENVRKKRGLICFLFMLAMMLALPIGASAATKITMNRSIKYAKKGYTIFVYNKMKGKNIKVYKRTNPRKGSYCTIEYGAAMVVNTSKLRTGKKYTMLPVYLNNRTRNGKMVTGYVKVSQVGIKRVNMKKASTNKTIRKAIYYGFRHLGTPFLLGAGDIDNQIDCANFVKAIYEYAGKSMPYPHTDYLQQVCYEIPKSRLKPGDLVFYLKNDTSGPIDHVGVYIGSGLMINSSGHYGDNYPQGGITVKRINYGNRKPVRCMRIRGLS